MDGTHGAYGAHEGYADKHIFYWRWIAAVVLLTLAIAITTVTYKTYAGVQPSRVEPAMPALPAAPKPVQPAVMPAVTDRGPELEAELTQWAAAQSGTEWGFYVRSLDDNSLNADIEESRQFDMASIYKLFILKPLAAKTPAEAWSANHIIGKSYQECVRLMLAVSDNPCAESLAETVGWSVAQKQINTDGYRNTIINDVSRFVSSPEDTGKLLERLHAGEGFDVRTKQIALDAMAQSKRTEAIRRACEGCQVLNKTGDLAGAKHDAGLVVKNGKAYVIVIFSKGASWNQLVQASKILNNYL